MMVCYSTLKTHWKMGIAKEFFQKIGKNLEVSLKERGEKKSKSQGGMVFRKFSSYLV